MKYRLSTILSISLFFTVSANPITVSAGDPIAGKAKATLCLTCHGADGTVQGAGTPIIAGQYEDYLVQALKSYKNQSRNNPIMMGFVATLSDKDIEDLAAYYSQLDSPLFTPTE